MVASRGRPPPNGIYAFVVPLVLGGTAEPTNLAPLHFAPVLAVLSQLTRAVQTIDPGSPLRLQFEGFPGSPPVSPASGRFVRAARDRPSFALTS